MTDSAYQPLERRPLRSRNTRWAEAIARHLSQRNISPNFISIFGLLAAIAAGLAFAATNTTSAWTQRVLWFSGGLLCQVRLLCNLFDGMVAIERKVASPTGELYNEVPDRVSDAAVFIGLGYAASGNVVAGYLAALLAVFVAYLRAMAKSVGAPNDFCGPMAKPQRMACATLLALYMTVALPAWRISWGEAQVVLLIVILGSLFTAYRRLRRAANHLKGVPR